MRGGGRMFSGGSARDLSVRSSESEWLDDPDIAPDDLALVLADLDRFNRAMLGHWPILRWLARAARDVPKDRAIVVLDVGCGSGDLLRAIRKWSRRADRAVTLIGMDLNPDAIAVARAMTPARDAIRFEAGDVFDYRPAAPVDVIVNSLVAHHLSDRGIAELLAWMEETARRGWLISDLQRSVVPYAFIGLMGKLTNLHPTVIHDGRISVARALTRGEWRARIADSGVPRDRVTIRWMLYRFLIGRLR
jgi:SAM-dependent methyltransferase